LTRGRSRKRYQSSRKITDENDHSQTGQGEEIATPPARHTSPRRRTEMNLSNTLQTEESGIGNDICYAASAVSPSANHQVQRVPLFTVDYTAKSVPNAAQILEDQQFEDPESQELFFNVLHQFGTETSVFLLGDWKNSNGAHLSTVKAAMQYS
jgi:hypothetical protein